MNRRLPILFTVLLTAALGACAGAGKAPGRSPEPGCIGLERLSAQVSSRSGGFLLPDVEASDRLRDRLRHGLRDALGARLDEEAGEQWPAQATALYHRVVEVALTRDGANSLNGLSVGPLPQAEGAPGSCPQHLVLQALVLPSSPGMAQLNLTLGLVRTSTGDLLQLRRGTLPTSAGQLPKESLERLLERWLGSYRS